MPRKPLDKRILRLANEAEVTITAHASLDAYPSRDMEDMVTTKRDEYPDLVWPWCDCTLTASYAGTSATITNRGLSYRDEDAYRRGGQYTEDLAKVLTKLLANLDAAAEAIAGFGGHE